MDEVKTRQVNVRSINNESLKSMAKHICLPGKSPDRSTINCNVWSNIFGFDFPVEANFLEVKKRSLLLKQMEKHAHTPELVISLNGPTIVPLAPAGDLGCSQENMLAVVLDQGEGLLLEPGTWHLAPFPVNDTAEVLVIYKKGTSQDDMVLEGLKPFVQLSLG